MGAKLMHENQTLVPTKAKASFSLRWKDSRSHPCKLIYGKIVVCFNSQAVRIINIRTRESVTNRRKCIVFLIFVLLVWGSIVNWGTIDWVEASFKDNTYLSGDRVAE